MLGDCQAAISLFEIRAPVSVQWVCLAPAHESALSNPKYGHRSLSYCLMLIFLSFLLLQNLYRTLHFGQEETRGSLKVLPRNNFYLHWKERRTVTSFSYCLAACCSSCPECRCHARLGDSHQATVRSQASVWKAAWFWTFCHIRWWILLLLESPLVKFFFCIQRYSWLICDNCIQNI